VRRAVSPDGRRFLMVKPLAAASPITVVLNSIEALKALVPGDGG
jgi:hypothetical protein